MRWELARHRLSVSRYHRVEEVDPRARNLSVGSPLTALFFGRDDGDYFRAIGVRLRWEPNGVWRGWYHLTLSAEGHRALSKEVDFSVAGLLGGDDTPFRPSLEAEEGTEFAAALGGSSLGGERTPAGRRGGVEILLQGAEGDFRWFRSRAVGRIAVPVPRRVQRGALWRTILSKGKGRALCVTGSDSTVRGFSCGSYSWHSGASRAGAEGLSVGVAISV